jgi:hypothetical protein
VVSVRRSSTVGCAGSAGGEDDGGRIVGVREGGVGIGLRGGRWGRVLWVPSVWTVYVVWVERRGVRG